MFESEPKSSHDTTPLLPKYRNKEEKDERSSSSSFVNTHTSSVIIFIACLASLLFVTLITYTSGTDLLNFTTLLEENALPIKFISANDSISNEESIPECDPTDGRQCAKRFLGYCYEHKPCMTHPTSTPTTVPTPKPSLIEECDPSNPPCLNKVLGICFTHSKCEGNIGSPTSYPTAKPTNLATCDPKNPPCINRKLGICWEFADCGDGSSSHHHHHHGGSSEPSSVPTPKPSTTTDCNPLKPPCKKDFLSFCYEYFDCAAEGNHDSYPNKPWFTPFPSKSPSSHPDDNDEDGEKGEKDKDGKVWRWEWNPSNNTFDLKWDWALKVPTYQPTTLHNCDPDHPPCKTWVLGVCTKYEKCHGVNNNNGNITWDDDDATGTYEPTPTPLSNPTPSPSFPPTSTPSTSAPTVRGYTPAPTISMMPTSQGTSGPTQFRLCNPDNPPCDNYFFGVCLGKRYCEGSHQPTPNPTPSPTYSTEFPTSSPTTAYPTPAPTLATEAPTEAGITYPPTVMATTVTPTVTVSLEYPNVESNQGQVVEEQPAAVEESKQEEPAAVEESKQVEPPAVEESKQEESPAVEESKQVEPAVNKEEEEPKLKLN